MATSMASLSEVTPGGSHSAAAAPSSARYPVPAAIPGPPMPPANPLNPARYSSGVDISQRTGGSVANASIRVFSTVSVSDTSATRTLYVMILAPNA